MMLANVNPGTALHDGRTYFGVSADYGRLPLKNAKGGRT